MLVSEYNKIVYEYSNRICRFADKMLMDKEAARDIAQEAFVRLWQHKENVDPLKVKAWLFTTAYRLTMDHISRNKKYVRGQAIPDRGEEQTPHDLKAVIHMLLKQLPEIQRSVLLLRDYEGYSYDEIARILDLNESQVKVYLFRARVKMKNYIKDLRLVL